MARSNRRCATSLQDVSKWTVPKRWSVSSWAKMGCGNARPAAIAAAATANADLIMGVSYLRRTLSRLADRFF
jgi:hypothetical protein